MSMTKPAIRGASITKSDTAVNAFRGIYVGTTGDLVVILQGDSTPTTFKNIAAGMIHPITTVKVMAATTASDLVGVL